MKAILFIILLAFVCSFSLYTLRCEDEDFYKVDSAAAYYYNHTSIPNGQYLIKKKCNGKIYSSGNNYYCYKYKSEDYDKQFIKKTKGIGEECKIDADCYDEKAANYRFYSSDSLECINGKCSDNWYF